MPETATNFATLPPDWVDRLQEPAAGQMAAAVRLLPVQTDLQPAPIASACVQASTGELGGGNPPLLLLPGFDSSLLEFRRLFPLLAAQRCTWALDLLGFGFTERPEGMNFSAAALQSHLYYFWKTWIGRRVVLVGASMGGAAALDFALRHPEAVKQLVLIDSAGVQPGPPGQFLIPPLGYLATEFLRSPRVRQRISENAYHDPQFATADACSCAALHLQIPGWRQALIRFTRSGGYGSLLPQLSQIRQPTLILWGKSDRILGTNAATRLQQAIPHSQLSWIEACGHVPHLEQPEVTATEIWNWLQSPASQIGVSWP